MRSTYVRIEQRFMKAVARINQQLYEQGCGEPSGFPVLGASANSTMASHAATTAPVIRVQAPRTPRVTKFNGNPGEWPAFRDLFVAKVHDEPYDDVSKLLYLQEACVDRAARTLGPCPPIAVNYQPAWQILAKAFDDPYLIVHGILSRACSIQRYERENYESLSAIVDITRSADRQLAAVTNSEKKFEQTWIFMLKQKMPRVTCEAWESYRNNKQGNKLPSLQEFLNFLDTKAKGKRELEYEDCSGESKAKSNNT